jgi:hypothetical protein
MTTADYKDVYVKGNVGLNDKKAVKNIEFGEVRTKDGELPVEKLILKTGEWITKEYDESDICGCEEYEGIILTAKTAYKWGIEFEIFSTS